MLDLSPLDGGKPSRRQSVGVTRDSGTDSTRLSQMIPGVYAMIAMIEPRTLDILICDSTLNGPLCVDPRHRMRSEEWDLLAVGDESMSLGCDRCDYVTPKNFGMILKASAKTS